ncbi:type I phosphomannose isomerase catalytic subunit [uncultured Alistipes sp.]|uniref:type I phosphomannose isomerase catalytic subunit n=1 Tax=uncultured Alistipes sp. TaxID=538949 RepID=UPI0025A68D30|nr:type I phosphomannose isomerase catalytic subunit [uncultured Alistipes sp.]MCX4282748.1 mannose-6-phosphate isomerase [Alistipes sp.]
MYKFIPILKSPLWGGEKIATYKQIATDRKQIGESWELSGVEGDVSVVAEGPDAGKTLTELLARDKERLLGSRNYERFGTEFPLLIKFIDAREDLSIQVHPDDRLAWERHRSKGKTEMWYVVAADEGAHLRSGFTRQVTPAEYEKSVADDTITDLLTDHEVRPGDVFFLPAGRIHSIGAGSFIAEIQQTSNITYRIYDFNRRDANGNLRELHTEQAKGAIDYSVEADYRTHYEAVKDRPVELVACPYFTTTLYDLTRPCEIDLAATDSFLVVMCIEGSGTLTDDQGSAMPLRQGETVLVPASAKSLSVSPQSSIKLLTSRID